MCMLGLNFGPGYGFGNCKADYGPPKFYADLDPSTSSAQNLGYDKVGIRARGEHSFQNQIEPNRIKL